MSLPFNFTSHSNQFPDDCVKNAFDKQAYLGNSFIASAIQATISSTAEIPIVLLQNPANSGKTLFVTSRRFVPLTNSTIFRSYVDPVITSIGTALPITNSRPATGFTSVASAYGVPLVTTDGTPASVSAALSYTTVEIDTLIILDPGHSLVITSQMNEPSPGSCDVRVHWFELTI